MKDGGLNFSNNYFQSNPDEVYRYSGSELEINPRFQRASLRKEAGYPSLSWDREEGVPSGQSKSRMAGDVFKDAKRPSTEELMKAGLRNPDEANRRGRMGKEDYNTPKSLFNELPEGYKIAADVKRPGE